VWQKQGGDEETFLYFSAIDEWIVSIRKDMEAGNGAGFMDLFSTALTPDQALPSEVWKLYDGTKLVASPEVQVRRQ
jgi:hypothetical protein